MQVAAAPDLRPLQAGLGASAAAGSVSGVHAMSGGAPPLAPGVVAAHVTCPLGGAVGVAGVLVQTGGCHPQAGGATLACPLTASWTVHPTSGACRHLALALGQTHGARCHHT